MFGYVRPFKDELLVREYEQYKAMYCGLCRQLGNDYGPLLRLTLSYDCTFVALLAVGLSETCPSFDKKRCVVNPAKKCVFCGESENRALQTAAAVSVILTYFKVLDDVADEGAWTRGKAKALRLLFSRAYRKAAKALPEVNEVVCRELTRQAELEKQADTPFDACCEPTANILAQVLSALAQKQEQKLVLSQLGYFLGRWIYIMDAADDLEEDLQKGSFNPFIAHFHLQKDSLCSPEQKQGVQEQCNRILNATAAGAVSAANLLSLYRFGPIVQNIIGKGLGEMQREILFLHVSKKERSPYRHLS